MGSSDQVRPPVGSPASTPFSIPGDPRLRRNGLPGLGQPQGVGARPFLPPPAVSLVETPPPKARADTPGLTTAHLYDLGLTTAAMGFHTAAIEALRNCTAQAPDHGAAWGRLAGLLRLAGEDGEADAASERALACAAKSSRDAGERQLANPDKSERKLRDLLKTAPPDQAMQVLRDRLVANPRDAAAMRLLARLEMRAGDALTAWSLLDRALDLCPGYIGAREDYAESLLERPGQAISAERQTRRLLAHSPRNPHYRRMHAYALIYLGKLAPAVEILASLAREHPRDPQIWLGYAQALHFLGRRKESEHAFRTCLTLQPGMGAAYWGLADLKGGLITDADIDAIRVQLGDDGLDLNSRVHMYYTLAQTAERAGAFAESFAAYQEGARLFRIMAEQGGKGHDPGKSATEVRRMKAVFSRENLDTRLTPAPHPAGADAPIFIVGMPRAGSTLVEQILASHSLVEGTRELPLIGDVKRSLAVSRLLVTPDAYPERILELTQDELSAFGAGVVERAREYRSTDRPFFIDKRPWNWLEAGLIHLILPQAKIIDIRREPMAACFAMYKQLLPNDAAFSYDLDDLGRYYNNYVSMMDHWRSVLPGRIHFVQYERLVDDTEAEIRGMLDYCGLPFEEGCLRFWETERAVSTPSAEQVRRPIFRDALQQWRNFEPWLGPLEASLSRPAEV